MLLNFDVGLLKEFLDEGDEVEAEVEEVVNVEEEKGTDEAEKKEE